MTLCTQQKALCVLAFSLCLVGCAVAPPRVPTINTPAAQHAWEIRQQALMAIDQWHLSGRIGVVNDSEGWHASVEWQKQPTHDRIDLMGPLGQGRVTVHSTPDGAQITTQAGRQWQAPDIDSALSQSLGVQLPVNGLRYWVRGLPTPGAPSIIDLDEQGRLTRLEQNGWVIEYPAYAPTATIELPTRIIARRESITVKLIIEQWEL